MTAPDHDPADEAPRSYTPMGLLVASSLCWVSGLVALAAELLILAVGMSLPHLAGWPFTRGMAIPLILALAYCSAGILLFRARVLGGLLAVITAGSIVGRVLHGSIQMDPIGLWINAAILALVVVNWSHLDRPRKTGSH